MDVHLGLIPALPPQRTWEASLLQEMVGPRGDSKGIFSTFLQRIQNETLTFIKRIIVFGKPLKARVWVLRTSQ